MVSGLDLFDAAAPLTATALHRENEDSGVMLSPAAVITARLSAGAVTGGCPAGWCAADPYLVISEPLSARVRMIGAPAFIFAPLPPLSPTASPAPAPAAPGSTVC